MGDTVYRRAAFHADAHPTEGSTGFLLDREPARLVGHYHGGGYTHPFRHQDWLSVNGDSNFSAHARFSVFLTAVSAAGSQRGTEKAGRQLLPLPLLCKSEYVDTQIIADS